MDGDDVDPVVDQNVDPDVSSDVNPTVNPTVDPMAGSPRGPRVVSVRLRTLAIAAFVVVVAVAGVVGLRSLVGTEASASDGTGMPHILPPEDAVDSMIRTSDSFGDGMRSGLGRSGYFINYTSPDGTQWSMAVSEPGLMARLDGTTLPEDLVANGDPIHDLGLPADSPRRDMGTRWSEPVVLTCLGSASESSATRPVGTVAAVGVPAGGWTFAIVRMGDPLSVGCDLDAPDVEKVIAEVGRVRRVDQFEWDQFLDEHRSPVMPPGTASIPTTTTLPSVAIPDEDAARAAVSAAFAGLGQRALDGTYPNLEGGSDADGYGAMFDQARVVSHATTPAWFEVTNIRFTSEQVAQVTFRAHAILESGPVDITLSGRAVNVGGTWLVARDTITEMLGRASIPPPRQSPTPATVQSSMPSSVQSSVPSSTPS